MLSHPPPVRCRTCILYLLTFGNVAMGGHHVELSPYSLIQRLLKYLGENAITRMLFTPSLLQLVLDQCEPEELREGMKTMRIVWLCGEVVTVELR